MMIKNAAILLVVVLVLEFLFIGGSSEEYEPQNTDTQKEMTERPGSMDR